MPAGVGRTTLDALDDVGRTALDDLRPAALGDFGGAALERGPALRGVGEVRAAARLVGALADITQMLYVGPPGGGLCVSHVVLPLFPWRPTG
jgi:hypothetical protein